nr:putative ribonuclease H-like domain-containing protein [Tanacetum cinerariifolium]
MVPMRTSTSAAPAMNQAAIQQLIDDRVAAALKAQATNMANADNTNRNPKPREVLVARMCSYKEFMSCQPFNFKGSKGVVGLIRWFEHTESMFSSNNCTGDCKVKFSTGTLTEEALSWWNSFTQPIRIEEAYKLSLVEFKKLLIKKYCPRTECKYRVITNESLTTEELSTTTTIIVAATTTKTITTTVTMTTTNSRIEGKKPLELILSNQLRRVGMLETFPCVEDVDYITQDLAVLCVRIATRWATRPSTAKTKGQPLETTEMKSNRSATAAGIEYEEVFTHVPRIEAIRLFLAYASFMGFMVYQMDVKSVFLYGTIEEEVYVCQPPGFEDPDYHDKVYKVVKALYGLHQAPRAWYETVTNYLLENGF